MREDDGIDGEKQTKERKKRAKQLLCQIELIPGLAVNTPFCSFLTMLSFGLQNIHSDAF